MGWLKKITLLIAGLLLLIVTIPGLYALLRKEQLTRALVSKVNEAINTKISYGTLKISMLESFPNITLRFNDLLISPSPYYDKTQFSNEDNDTLLFASSLSITAFLPSLFTGTVSVRSVAVRGGEANLLTDKRGDINYEVMSEMKEKNGRDIRLRAITAREMRIIWHDRSSETRVSGSISDATLGGKIFKAGIFLNTTLSASIDSASVSGMNFTGIPVSAELRLRKSDKTLSIAKGVFGVAGFRFDLDGNINYTAKNLNLYVEGRKINISSVIAMLPDKWRLQTGDFGPSGIVDIKGTVSGPYGQAGKPHFRFIYNLSGGRFRYRTSGIKVNNLEFRGSLTNGDLSSPETFIFTVDNLSASYGSASLKGSLMIDNLARPHITLALDGDLDFNDLSKITGSSFITNQTGRIMGKVRLSGFLPDSMMMDAASLQTLNPNISLIFNDFSADMGKSRFSPNNVNGTLIFKNDLVAENLSLNILNHHLRVNVTMLNFIPWIAGKPETLVINGDVEADRFVTAIFTSAKEDSTGRKESSPNIFPPDVTADIRLRADSLVSKDFRAGNFTCSLNYRPYVITFRDVRADALGGLMTGEFMLGKQKDSGYITRTELNVTDIDIRSTFKSFNDFSQTFISADNLAGNLTGNVTVLAPLDDSYRIVTPAIVAEAHLLISEGRLVNFAPAVSLSSYLDLDELRDIRFSKMENDLLITGGTVSLPKMLINSSAVNFTVYGTHHFNGDYEYHIRLLLSEVLSRKARERNRNVTAFGKVQVDGTGRATIPLKITCADGRTSVGYDFGQAQDNIRNDIATEKKVLKGILNEEYGWYMTDTAKVRPAESRPKFTITWEEGKIQPSPADTAQEEVSDNPIRILFRKKK